MNIRKWIENNTYSLEGKKVAVTGTTGGLGKELCRYLAGIGASLLLLDRNEQRSNEFRKELIKNHSDITVKCINIDLEDVFSVKNAVEMLKKETVDVFIHNAGAYSIPRHKCYTGLDNVFQINFASPYYIIKELLDYLRNNAGRVVVVGSIAHNYSKYDPEDIDFSTRKQASKVYGNAKRYLMFSLYELFKNEDKASLAVTHPGISFTNITAHYPKLIFAVIKYPMKLIFMKPKKACLSVVRGIFDPCKYHEWIGPAFFDVWGLPKKKKLTGCSLEESRQIGMIADKVYESMKR